jgi:Spy/CpxP family protein refolding chaperone
MSRLISSIGRGHSRRALAKLPLEFAMKMHIPVIAVLLSNASFASAQPTQPYAGFEQRPVKALSDQQIADLRSGRGMGLALAAELNGYPGPVHVLEHAQALRLTPEQRQRTQALYDSMKAETIPLGERLIAQEAGLDRAFAEHTIMPQALTDAADAIGGTQGALRAAHLRYHLAQLEVLTPEQAKQYAELRGYAGGNGVVPSHQPAMQHGR